MGREIGPNGDDFNALAEYLRAELGRTEADKRAIHIASADSFRAWAQSVLGALAEQLGVTLGYLVGMVASVYETTATAFGRGWRDGLDRGRGRP